MSSSLWRTLPSLSVALALSASLLPACGGSNDGQLLSRTRASELRATLDRVEQQINVGDCTAADQQVRTFQQEVGALSRRIDSNLRDTLAEGASRLQTLVVNRCQSAGPTGPTAVPQPETTQEEKPKEKQKPKETGKGKAKGHEKNQQDNQGDEIPLTPQTGGEGTSDNSGGAAP